MTIILQIRPIRFLQDSKQARDRHFVDVTLEEGFLILKTRHNNSVGAVGDNEALLRNLYAEFQQSKHKAGNRNQGNHSCQVSQNDSSYFLPMSLFTWMLREYMANRLYSKQQLLTRLTIVSSSLYATNTPVPPVFRRQRVDFSIKPTADRYVDVSPSYLESHNTFTR